MISILKPLPLSVVTGHMVNFCAQWQAAAHNTVGFTARFVDHELQVRPGADIWISLGIQRDLVSIYLARKTPNSWLRAPCIRLTLFVLQESSQGIQQV